MKKTKLFLFALLMLLSINLFAQRTTLNLTFVELINGVWVEKTDLTINDIRLKCVEGTYLNYIIWPTYVNNPTFTHIAHGQYTLGWFNGGTFLLPNIKYEVIVQRKINSVWTDQNQFGYFWIGDFGENIDSRLANTDTNNQVRIWGNQTVTGRKHFTGAMTVDTSINVPLLNVSKMNYYGGYPTFEYSAGKMWLGSYTAGTPLLNGSPLYGNSAIPKNYMTSYVDAKLLSYADSNFQESQNIIRLIPDGIAQTGQVYTTYSSALTYCTNVDNRGMNRVMTIVVPGMGINASGIVPSIGDSNKFCIDYVNFKASGENVTLDFGYDQPADGYFKGTEASRITYEGFIIKLSIDQENEIFFENVTFKNCTFVDKYGNIAHVYFTGCRFLGTNYFGGFQSNVLSFTNCYGTAIYSNSEITRAGLVLVPALTPTKFYIGANYIQYPYAYGRHNFIFADSLYTNELDVCGNINMGLAQNSKLDLGQDSYIQLDNVNQLHFTTSPLSTTINFVDGGAKYHTVVITNGLIMSWEINEGDQLK